MNARNHALAPLTRPSPALPRLSGWLDSLTNAFTAWRQREAQRRVVARMSARDAADFGVTKQQLEFELERPIARAIRWL